MKAIIITLMVFATTVTSDKFRFDNYSLFKIKPQNEQHMKILQELQKSDAIYDFWTDPVPSAEFVSVMAAPLQKKALENFLNFYDIDFEIAMANVQEAIDKETVNTYTRNSRIMRWDTYYTLSDIEAWMNDLAIANPTIVTALVGGFSYEGREIKGLKISHGAAKRVIFIESGIHAREWIAPAAACYIINELLTSDDEEIRNAARDFDWYIFPVTNPDGYVWSHTEFRLWRKNRRPIGSNFGVDLNRNWNSNWLVEGVSVDPVADNYAGLGPFSESETRSLSTFISTVSDRIEMYISFHSFSQLLLIPYGNTTQPLDNYYDAINIGRRAMGALSVRYGTEYVTGNIAEAIYHATGTSIDWVKEHLKVPLVYCYEFRDKGTYGFLLPTDQILPNNQETMDSIIELVHQAKRFGYLNNSITLKASTISLFIIVFVFLEIMYD